MNDVIKYLIIIFLTLYAMKLFTASTDHIHWFYSKIEAEEYETFH